MRKVVLFVLILLCIGEADGQQVVRQQQMRLDEKTIVRDSGGTVYPYIVWLAMMHTNEYGFTPFDSQNKDSGLIIYKLNEKERQRRNFLGRLYAAKTLKPAESKFFTTGQKISLFKEKDMDGNKFSLKAMRGKIVVLNFWFIGCPPCREEIPALNELVEKYHDNPDVVFIAVALDDYSSLRKFLQMNPFNYHIISDGSYLAQRNYSINLYPTHVVVDKSGIVRFHTSGGGAGVTNWLQKTIDELVNEKSEK